MKITLIITSLSLGGAERMLFNFLERLSTSFSAQVICLTDIGPIGQRIQALGVPVIALNMPRAVPNPFALFRLVRLLKLSKPDIVHTWMYHADLLGGIAARLAGVPLIVWHIHNSDLSPEKTKLSTRLVADLCARLSWSVPDKILTCSRRAQDIHEKLGYESKKFLFVPNGTDLNKFQPNLQARESIRQELGIAANAPLVGLIARFDPQKNHVGFFEAAGSLHQKRPDVHFLLAGYDVDTANHELMVAIDRAKVRHVTHLLGMREDIPYLMASLDVLVVSASFGEAFPMVLVEAMACEVPCVVTDVGDSAYIVGDTGKVVANNNMPELAVALETLLSLPSAERLKLGQKARLRIAENFEIGKVANLYASLYKELYLTNEEIRSQTNRPFGN